MLRWVEIEKFRHLPSRLQTVFVFLQIVSNAFLRTKYLAQKLLKKLVKHKIIMIVAKKKNKKLTCLESNIQSIF